MKARNLLMFVLMLVTAGLLQAEEKAVKEISNTRYARVELRITTDPKVLTHNEVSSLLFDNTAKGRMPKPFPGMFEVSSEILGQENWEPVLRVTGLRNKRIVKGVELSRIKLFVSLDETYEPAAQEFLEAYIDEIKSQLKKEFEIGREIYADKFDQYRNHRHEAEMQFHNLLAQQNQLSDGRGALDKESVRQRIYEHQQKVIGNDMQQAVLQKRAEELVKQISQANMENDQADAIDAELTKLQNKREALRAQYKELDRTRNDLSAVLKDTQDRDVKSRLDEVMKKLKDIEPSINEIDGQIHQVSLHKSRLRATAAEEIQELNRQFREVTIRQEELEIEEAILYGYGPESLSDSEQYEILEVHIQAVRENLHRAITEADAFKAQMDQIMPPKVSYDEITALETVPKAD